ncbi:MAG: phosphopantetheine-binding protein, partial [Nostoc sp.]
TTETTVTDAAVPVTTKIVESQPLPVTEPVAKNGLNVTQAPLPAAVEPVVETPVSPETRSIASLLPTPHFATFEPVAASPVPVVEAQTELVVKISSPPVNEVIAEPAPTTAAPVSGASIDIVDLDKNLLAITSDKTGYPVEMLEMDMDMEADLGIDSIKRVEILGALQEMYPNLPKPNL